MFVTIILLLLYLFIALVQTSSVLLRYLNIITTTMIMTAISSSRGTNIPAVIAAVLSVLEPRGQSLSGTIYNGKYNKPFSDENVF